MARYSIYFVLASVLILICIGIVMLSSTGAFAQDSHGDMYYFVKRQSIWVIVGLIACVLGAVIDYHWWQKTWYIWFGVSALLLAACFVPPLGMRINGSWRWLNLGIMAFQPSELAKLASVFFLAWWFTRFEKRMFETKVKNFFYGLIFPGALIAIILALIALEVDMGSTALIGAVMFGMMFVAGSSLFYLVPLVLLGIMAGAYAATQIPERMERILAFMHPEAYRLTEGLQQWQALIAFGSGGLTGLGLGEGRQKMLYLPYAHTDFIFPMIGEELGLQMTLIVVFAFLVLCMAGCQVAIKAKDRVGLLIGFGCIMLISLQAIVNIGMTTSCLPNKGMPLPFISYGGSNIAICLFMIGILINIHRQIRHPVAETRIPALEYRPVMRC